MSLFLTGESLSWPRGTKDLCPSKGMTCDVLSGILHTRTLRLPDALSRVTQQFMTARRLRTRICAEGLRAEAKCRRGVREILGNVTEGVLGRVRVEREGTSLAEITVRERGRWRGGGGGEWAPGSLRRHGDEEPGKGLCLGVAGLGSSACVGEATAGSGHLHALSLTYPPAPQGPRPRRRLAVQLVGPDSAADPLVRPWHQLDPPSAVSSSMKWANTCLPRFTAPTESLSRVQVTRAVLLAAAWSLGLMLQDTEWKLLGEGCPAFWTPLGQVLGCRRVRVA